MKQIVLILSNQANFTNRIQSLWKQCFSNIELHIFSWILKNPELITLLENKNVSAPIIIIDDSFVKNILTKNGADTLFQNILNKFPSSQLIYAFDQSWIKFFKKFPQSICICIKCDDPQDLLILHISRILKSNTKKTIQTSTKKKKTLEPMPIAKEVIIRERHPIDIKKLVKSTLYSLLNQIEQQNVQLKISLPEQSITIVENKDLLSTFITEHIQFLISKIGGKGYSFIQVNISSAYKQCIIKILHSKITDKILESNRDLNIITNDSSTQVILNTPEGEPPTTHQSIRSSTQPKILIVEDEELMLEMILTTLESEGFIAEGFSNSVEAAEAIDRFKYDLILTDINIPNFSGFQVINTIKKSKYNKDAKIVAMTGLQNEYTIQSIKDLNLDGFLNKPFSLEKLSQLLKRLLHKSDD
ncbi:MAG: hypothetical protein COB02_03610 [Candidatus Cloacimonadota bacterium]|nr:MAG: hypothetical protein COB02_03610 [Candidatus Cloacimonadota bacterium]